MLGDVSVSRSAALSARPHGLKWVFGGVEAVNSAAAPRSSLFLLSVDFQQIPCRINGSPQQPRPRGEDGPARPITGGLPRQQPGRGRGLPRGPLSMRLGYSRSGGGGGNVGAGHELDAAPAHELFVYFPSSLCSQSVWATKNNRNNKWYLYCIVLFKV